MISHALNLVLDFFFPRSCQERDDLKVVQRVQPLHISLPDAPIPALTGGAASTGLGEHDYMLMAIKLADLVRVPIRNLRVIERYKRVFVVAFEPHGWIDPVMPLTAVPLGPDHDHAYMRLAELLQAWGPERDDHRQWYLQAKKWALECAGYAGHGLLPDEAQYYATQLLQAVSLPGQRR